VDAAFRAAALDPATILAYAHPNQWITLARVLHDLPTDR
jgi:23S rRNA (adenine-N6)-dimethyltransferase